jgi:formylglycine-generating enzyme required for sulfatase activity
LDNTSDRAPGLFDRLRIQVFKKSDIEDPSIQDRDNLPEVTPVTQRDFSVHIGLFEAGPVSFGIAPGTDRDERYVVRVQLFRADRLRRGNPPRGGTLETRFEVPSVSDRSQDAFVMLRTENVGTILGLDEPLEPETDVPATSLVDTWEYTLSTPCEGEASPDEVCIPGGAFLMGDPSLEGNPGLDDSHEERIVAVSPYFIDLREVTIAEFAQRFSRISQEPGVVRPPQWAPGDLAAQGFFATLTDDTSEEHPGTLPVNGVTWATARAYCMSLGKDLPSEAMFEYLASGQGDENNYVWGNDEPDCESAVVGRGGLGGVVDFRGDCRPPTSPGGVLPVGSATEDRVRVVTGSETDDFEEVVDLAGNLAEWALDHHVANDSGSWAGVGPLIDPVAEDDEDDDRAVRGGSWLSSFVNLRAAAKRGAMPDQPDLGIGFRCGRPGR